jgi:hypothetical protein
MTQQLVLSKRCRENAIKACTECQLKLAKWSVGCTDGVEESLVNVAAKRDKTHASHASTQAPYQKNNNSHASSVASHAPTVALYPNSKDANLPNRNHAMLGRRY